MLVLTRKLKEVIKIGDEVEIHVLKVQGNRVKLGIIAPKEISVCRMELTTRTDEEEKPSEQEVQ